MLDKIKREQNEYGKNIFVFGASQQGRDLLEKLKEKKINITAFVDNDPEKQGTLITGIPVINPNDICEYDKDKIIVIIASSQHASEMKKQLKSIICCEMYELEEVYMFYNSVYKKLTIPANDAPNVSVILTVYNQWDYTYNCVKSFINCKSNIAYEFIIGDNASTDTTVEMEDIITGAKIIHRKENIGYLKNVNETVKEAKGKYILIMQNDTYFIDDYWLDILVNYMENNEECGAVAPYMCGFDGKYGIGGCNVGTDGKVVPIIGTKSNIPYSVAYIQPAAVLIRKDLWEQEKGFDEVFCPAWCEDEDFYLKLHDKGKDVVICPKVRYIHYGSKTCGSCPDDILNDHLMKLLNRWERKIPYINEDIKMRNASRGLIE